MTTQANQALIVDTNVQEYFQDMVQTAVANQGVEAAEETVVYLVNLLTSFIHTRTLYEQTPDGLLIRPLASLYAEAVEADSSDERNRALKRLGDVALFISGVFSDSLNRKLIDVDYYIAMGGNAYSYLSDNARNTTRWHMFTTIFDELATNFVTFVDVLDEVSEQAHFRADADIMRLYEVWIRTGSRRAERQLQRLGIAPARGSVSRLQH